MEYQEILYEPEGPILTITLNRPAQLNAATIRMHAELIDAADRFDADDRVRVVIFTGAGRAFCAGTDLSSPSGTLGTTPASQRIASEFDPETVNGIRRDGGGKVILRLFECSKPMIAAVNGSAVGFGINMTLPMDVRLVAEGAKIGFVFTRRGIVPESCSSWFLPRVVGISQAMEWMVSGRVFPAAEALAGGLFKEMLPAPDLLPRAREIARDIAENTSAISVTLARQLMWRMMGADHPMEAHKLESRALTGLTDSADRSEGVQSFKEKRPPRFTGRPSADMPSFYPWWKLREFE
jgi:enoyl-CoA hydratase/carnithine racemase